MNLEYKVDLLPPAQRDLSKLPDSVVVKLEAAVLDLADDPRGKAKKL